MRLTFHKGERLNSKLLIEKLFRKGKSFYVYPFRVSYLVVELNDIHPVQLLISVPRKNFKNATDRNRIKRLIREAYRKHKKYLYAGLEGKNVQLLLALVYTARAIPEYPEVEKKIILILQRLIERDEPAAG